MEFIVEYTRKALKMLEVIDKKDSVRVYRKIELIKPNPLHYIEKLTSVNLWKLRVGDYRAIIRLNQAKGIISVIDIGHRRSIYKNL